MVVAETLKFTITPYCGSGVVSLPVNWFMTVNQGQDWVPHILKELKEPSVLSNNLGACECVHAIRSVLGHKSTPNGQQVIIAIILINTESHIWILYDKRILFYWNQEQKLSD